MLVENSCCSVAQGAVLTWGTSGVTDRSLPERLGAKGIIMLMVDRLVMFKTDGTEGGVLKAMLSCGQNMPEMSLGILTRRGRCLGVDVREGEAVALFNELLFSLRAVVARSMVKVV